MTTFTCTRNPYLPGVYRVLVVLHSTTLPRPGDPPLFAYFDGVDTWSGWEFSETAALRSRPKLRGVRPWAPLPKPDDDTVLWKSWWMAALYGAGPEMRMLAVDRQRGAIEWARY